VFHLRFSLCSQFLQEKDAAVRGSLLSLSRDGMEQGDAPQRAEKEGQGMILGGLRAQLQGQAAAAQTTWNAIESQSADVVLADEDLQFLQAKKHKREQEEDTYPLKRCKSDEQSNEKEEFVEVNEALPTEETTVVGLFRGPVAPYIGNACSGYVKHPVEMVALFARMFANEQTG